MVGSEKNGFLFFFNIAASSLSSHNKSKRVRRSMTYLGDLVLLSYIITKLGDNADDGLTDVDDDENG
jgi:hypothetical protein